ncbi:NAD(P)-dependent oxidoreductase [Frondihabitans cladoniiphilus]|uniref:NAD(P)-dependent oxidoreductase n=1 Tax=Frondihabitans cladoniiphilus TaxID=715785 RepID=A0ABP8W5U9_9MICO
MEPAEPPAKNEEFIHGDLTDRALTAEAVKDVDVVVHLGGVPSERPWSTVLQANIDGTESLLSAAASIGVPRVLLASSIHAVGFTPLSEARSSPVLDPRPDSYYGVSKVAVEGLGRVYADRYPMLIVAARIANFAPEPTDRRGLSFWCSPDDLARLALATATTEATGFHVVWGVSANTRSMIDSSAGLEIGFVPRDNAEYFASSLPDDDSLGTFLGGSFTRPEARLGLDPNRD